MLVFEERDNRSTSCGLDDSLISVSRASEAFNKTNFQKLSPVHYFLMPYVFIFVKIMLLNMLDSEDAIVGLGSFVCLLFLFFGLRREVFHRVYT